MVNDRRRFGQNRLGLRIMQRYDPQLAGKGDDVAAIGHAASPSSLPG
jgi:hypothetical protein